ncbi:diguanylate cyclase [Photobacterium aquimaris]|uniref:diguanylate cyclase n=1 Tax=Photobacterium aquimaris TaxID=512643 RepID=A0A2T3IRZ5_9GAMM|nr:diguanylate cyclase [Photobacterium aquimaris]OBU15111.1 diguanylate cyclase [Photobacterium aquimaris]OBU23424.1 diguanylate cyclase [Photobacterium aquimaris]PSU31129.1 GGDEF domain-containing protein [Photobacterium aquimaris]PSW01884.1 GGDEF domain-containing protein [Photobacterium aquimaris]
MNKQVAAFYQTVVNQCNNAHSLRTICELICRNLMQHLAVNHLQLIIKYNGKWKVLLDLNSQGIHYHFPPIDPPTSNEYYYKNIHYYANKTTASIDVLPNYRYILVPLKHHSAIIGHLTLAVPLDSPLIPKHFAILATLLAAEINNSLTQQTTKHHSISCINAEKELLSTKEQQQTLLNKLQSMHDISFQLWRCNSMRDMLFIAIDEAKKQLQIDRMAIFLFDEQKNMHGTFGTDIDGNTVDESYFSSPIPNQWYASKTLKDKEYLAIQENTPLFHDLKQIGFGWSAYIALWDEDTPIGWIACDNLITGQPLRTYHHQLLKQYGLIVSQHILRLQAADNLIKLNHDLEQRVQSRTEALNKANEQLQKLSRIDALTNIANRRVFDETVVAEWRRASRLALPLSLLILDIDNFKTYNDKLGHAAGDQCLKTIATALSTVERRAGTLFARYGGEEFVLLLPGQDQQQAKDNAQRLLNAIHDIALPFPCDGLKNNNHAIVTISIGVSTIIPSQSKTYDDFFKQVDMALYQAKAKGKNGFSVLSPTL